MKILMRILLLLLSVAAGCTPQQSPQLHPKIVKAMKVMGDVYAAPKFCGNVVRIEYAGGKFPDGAPTYFDNSTGNLIVACPSPMTRPTVPPAPRVCPPAKWTCGGVW